jgi:hypothetical protein
MILQIEDNGIELTWKNRDKLFGMYKTFHNNEDARGIGLLSPKIKLRGDWWKNWSK